MINILHVTEDHSQNNTGITSAVDGMVRQLSHVFNQEILSIGPEAVPTPERVQLNLLKASLPWGVWRAAPSQLSILRQKVTQADIVQLHGIWMWPQWAAAKEARRLKRPIVLTTHGMLEPLIWQQNKVFHQLKKIVYWHLVAYPIFRFAAIIHAITPEEAKNLSIYFPNHRIEIIPNSLDLDQIERILADCPPDQPVTPYILFLGRLHPIKGIDMLIQSFVCLRGSNVKLKIAGPVQEKDKGYNRYLSYLVSQLGLEKQVEFLGSVRGKEKWILYRNAWAFFLPSHSEVISMVNLEASACRTPVITTIQSGVTDLWASHGGLLIQPTVAQITESLKQVIQWSKDERDRRGDALHNLVEQTYSSKVIAPKWVALFEELAKVTHG